MGDAQTAGRSESADDCLFHNVARVTCFLRFGMVGVGLAPPVGPRAGASPAPTIPKRAVDTLFLKLFVKIVGARDRIFPLTFVQHDPHSPAWSDLPWARPVIYL